MNCLVLDDHPLVCEALKLLVSSINSVDSVITHTSSKSVLNTINESEIGLIILDVGLSDCDGFDFYRRLRAHGYKNKVLFYSANEEYLYSEMARNIGADGYICKSEDSKILIDAIEGICNGYTFFKLKRGVDHSRTKSALSNRETIVIRYILKGLGNKEIANILSISDKTVSTYKRRILSKFKVKNLVELQRCVGSMFDDC